MSIILINPPAGGNYDIPCVPLGYLSALWDCDVLDFNHGEPDALDLAVLRRYKEAYLAVQSRSLSWSEAVLGNSAIARTVTTPIETQCCYKFLALENNYHIETLPPVPRYDRFSSYPTFLENWKSGKWPYALYTSWGCPYRCTYCDARETGHEGRPYSHLRAEMDHAVYKLGIRRFTVLDDCFNLNEAHAVNVSRLIESYDVEWMCTNGLRADRLTESSAKAMQKSGCTTVGFGVESSDDEVLVAVRKGESIAEVERGLAIARNHFDSVSTYVIVGMPESTPEKDRATIDWAIRQGVYVHVSDFKRPEEEKNFYGDEMSELAMSAKGLSWGSKRSILDALFARFALLLGWGPRVAWRFIRMDIKKAVHRWS